MYAPHFCLRVEIALTDSDDLREFHLVLGGAQRGGVSVLHGYIPERGGEIEDVLGDIQGKMRELLEAYVCTWTATQLALEIP
jgi:hypothetical protein